MWTLSAAPTFVDRTAGGAVRPTVASVGFTTRVAVVDGTLAFASGDEGTTRAPQPPQRET
jgi:hypothetical protein